MAKTKYIVPAVAMLLCAVSLIGAGYAAYSATLQDNETTTANSNYITLTLGNATTLGQDINIYYDYQIVYGGQNPGYKYTPYLDADTTTGAKTVSLGPFVVEKDKFGTAGADFSAYSLGISNLSITGTNPSTLTGATITAFTDSACTQAVQGNLSYGTTYYIGLTYDQTGTKDLVQNAEPDEHLTISYQLLATAVFA